MDASTHSRSDRIEAEQKNRQARHDYFCQAVVRELASAGTSAQEIRQTLGSRGFGYATAPTKLIVRYLKYIFEIRFDYYTNPQRLIFFKRGEMHRLDISNLPAGWRELLKAPR